MTEEELAVYKEWQEARLNKDFEKADIARAKLVEWKLV
jgi:cysteinyl-tRNA synthetase